MRGLVMGLLASALIAQGASAEWALTGNGWTSATIEGASEEGTARLKIVCERAKLELNFAFADGSKPSHIRYKLDDQKRWRLEEGKVPGPGLTLVKPYSYAVLLDFMGAKRVTVESFHLNTPIEPVRATFDMQGFKDIADKHGDICLFRSTPPRA